MSAQSEETSNRDPQAQSLPDPYENSRMVIWSVLVLVYGTFAGLLAGNGNLGFVAGLGAGCGLGLHQLAIRQDWPLRFKNSPRSSPSDL